MNTLMNILWFIFCGFWQMIGWALAGCLWSITIIGLPVGIQCFKFAGFCAMPFGHQIVYGGGTGSFLLNLIWIFISGIPLALSALANGAILCLSIIGIPLGLQCFKFAKLAFMPFGTRVM